MKKVFDKILIFVVVIWTLRMVEDIFMIKVDIDKCVGCGGCIDLCPATAISLVNDKSYVNADLCLECETCVKVCPVKAPQIV